MGIKSKKYALWLGAAVMGLTINGAALAERYELDPTHSFIQFSISHLGFSLLQGRFNEMSGEFHYDEKNPNAAKISVSVNTASVDSNHAERDKHIRNEDFLNVDKFPTAKFVSSSFNELGGDKAELKGDLTLHGVTKPITVDVKFIGAGTDPWGGYRRGYVGTTTIKRSDYGISYNLGPAAESMELQFFIEGIRK